MELEPEKPRSFDPKDAPENKKAKRGKSVKKQTEPKPKETKPKETKQEDTKLDDNVKDKTKKLITDEEKDRLIKDLDKLEKQLLSYHKVVAHNFKYPFLLRTEEDIKMMIAREMVKIRLNKQNDLLEYLE